jgi:hypothetical protein
MKPNLKVVTKSIDSKPRHLKLLRKPIRLFVVRKESLKSGDPDTDSSLVQSKPNEKPVRSVRSILRRCFNSVKVLMARIDKFATESRATDERIRKIRSEHYAKYGWYFRDRF